MWQMAAYLGLDLARGHYAAKGVRIDNRLREQLAAAERVVNSSQNVLKAAVGSANARRRSRQNQEILTAAGKQKDAAIMTINRLGDMATRGKLSQRLQAAESLGALSAAAGSAGIGGGSSSMLAATMRLRADRIAQQSEAEVDQKRSDIEGQFREIMVRASLGMDDSVEVAGVSNVPIYAKLQQVPGRTDIITQSIANTFFSGKGAEKNRQMFTDMASSWSTPTVAAPSAVPAPPLDLSGVSFTL